MSGLWLLIELMGAMALLVFSTRMVKTGVLLAHGEALRSLIGRETGNPLAAAATGFAVATAVQSSSATALLLAGFAERGLIGLAAALALLLGADIGSALVVQILSLKVTAVAPLLMLAGVLLFSRSSTALRQAGRVLIGLALIMVALGLVGQASRPLRDSELVRLVLQRLSDDILLGVALGAAITFAMQSSVAFLLLVLSLAAGQLIGPVTMLAMIAGANLGSAAIPLALTWSGPAAVRRIMVGSALFRLAGVALAVPFIPLLADLGQATGLEIAPLGALAHLALNLLIAILGLPLVGMVAGQLTRLVLDRPDNRPDPVIMHLDEAALDKSDIALAHATRELMRLADMVERMLRDVMVAFSDPDAGRREAVGLIDNRVDELQDAIKLYLTRLSRRPLSDLQGRQCLDLILFTTNLEHAGDIIDKSLLQLAAKKQRQQLAFSEAGRAEISGMHRRVLNQLHLAIACFVSRDTRMARELVAEKDRLRDAEQEATRNHLARLRDGTVQSLKTSTLHLDILRDLKRINAHVTAVANPILEASGELRASRLAPAV
jgi:phosphate:Na+ symporter